MRTIVDIIVDIKQNHNIYKKEIDELKEKIIALSDKKDENELKKIDSCSKQISTEDDKENDTGEDADVEKDDTEKEETDDEEDDAEDDAEEETEAEETEAEETEEAEEIEEAEEEAEVEAEVYNQEDLGIEEMRINKFNNYNKIICIIIAWFMIVTVCLYKYFNIFDNILDVFDTILYLSD